MRALLTGFEPWKGSPNPAGTIAKNLNAKKFDGLEVVGVEVPEDFYGLPEIALSLVKRYRPRVVISLGWDYTSSIKVEKVARNTMNSEFGGEDVPDNSGNLPKDAPVIAGGAPMYKSTLPAESIVDAIKAEGIPAVVSYDAGTHCCNTMMYSFLRALKRTGRGTLSGHIHVPPTPGMKVHGVKPMDLETERRAIRIALATCARHIERGQVMPGSSILQRAAEYEAYRKTTLNLIPSENVLSPDALKALSSPMAGRYAGEPESYGGSTLFHALWKKCEDLARLAFRCKAVSVSPISGHVAGMMVLGSLAKSGDTVATIAPEDGGYKGYASGFIPTMLGMKVVSLPFNRMTMNIDIDNASRILKEEKPALVILGATVFLFPHPVGAIAETVHSYGGRVFFDASHVLGLVAGRTFQDPLAEGADVVAGSTHKTLFGPQGGIILADDKEIVRSIEGNYLYRFMDNFHLNRVAALGVALEETILHAGIYSKKVVENARRLAEKMDELGLRIAARESGYTRSHQVLLQAGARGVETRDTLEKAGIIVDSRVRFGTNEVTRRGMGTEDMEEIAKFSNSALTGGDLAKIRKRVKTMASRFSEVQYTLGSRRG